MPRRASSHIHPGYILGAVALIVAAILVGKTILGKSKNSFANVLPLDIRQVMENANSLRGNEYVVEGQIDEKLQWTSDRGQLISVKVETPGGDEFIAIMIPPQFNRLNMDVKQKYAFRVQFQQGGIAIATAIQRL